MDRVDGTYDGDQTGAGRGRGSFDPVSLSNRPQPTCRAPHNARGTSRPPGETSREQEFSFQMDHPTPAAVALDPPQVDPKALARKFKVLQAITKAQHAYIAQSETAKLFDDMLVDLLEVSESGYGAIGQVLFKEDGAPYFKSHAVTNIAWNEETLRLYEENVAAGLEFHNLKSLFGSVLTTGEVVITNTPQADPRSGGLPPGHPPMTAFLGAPFFHSGVMIGMVLLANRPGGYDQQLLEDIGPFLTTCAGIIESHRAEKRREEQERRLIAAKEAAEVASKAKSAFLTNISHELRTPLTAVLGFANLLLKNPKENLDNRQLKFLGRIHDRGMHLLSLVEDVLDLSKVEAGALTIELQTAEIGAIAREVAVALGENHPNPQVQLSTEFLETEIQLETDPTRFRQLVENLVGNALKFTPKGTIVVRLGLDEGGAAFLEVQDSGIGIPADLHEHIFLPFRQVEEGTTRAYDGIGLGLTIARQIAEQLGYTISLTSELGRGSTFRVDIPVSGAPAADES